MIQKQGEITLFSGTYQGHELVIREMVWNDEIAKLAPDLAQDYYCGYVEILPNDYYYDHLDEAKDKLTVFGGITYTQAGGRLPALPVNKRFVGFNTAYAFQPHYTLDTVKQNCFGLIEQIVKRNYDTPAGVLC